MSSTELMSVGFELRRLGFDDLVERSRSSLPNHWEPWVGTFGSSAGAPLMSTQASTDLFRVLHLGEEVSSANTSPELLHLTDNSSLTVRNPDRSKVLPGRWRVSSFRGILVAAESAYGTDAADVHLGEDSLRFANFILKTAPRGHVLDVGSGSGISTAACAKSAESVTAIDVLRPACEATRTTAELNLLQDRISVLNDDFRGSGLLSEAYDSIVANLPGVPVPNGISYPTAGNGGEDGLDLIRSFWEHYRDSGTSAALIMRFQSLGSATSGPVALQELKQIMGDTHHVSVTADSAAPVILRDSITARRASVLMNRSIGEVQRYFNEQRVAAGYDTFYCCSLLAVKSPTPGLSYVSNLPQLSYERIRTPSLASVELVRRRFTGSLHLLPDEYWSLGEPPWESLIVDVIEQAMETLQRQLSFADTIKHVTELIDPKRVDCGSTDGLGILIGLLASCMGLNHGGGNNAR